MSTAKRIGLRWTTPHRPEFFLGIVILYSLFMASIRLVGSPVIGVDDVVEILFSQQWRFVYDPRQPPLYTWMLTGLIYLMGPGLMPILLLKYGHLILIAWIGHAIARRISSHPVQANLVVFSLVLLWQIGWNLHEGVTHTLPLIACCLGTIWLLLRIAEERKIRDWLTLGLVISLGVLSKYSYLAFLAALSLALLSDRPWRALIWDRRLGLTIIPAMGLTMPHALEWLASNNNALSMAQTVLGQDNVSFHLLGITQGILRLAGASIGFLSPLVPVLCVFMPRSLQPGWIGGLTPLPDNQAWAERLLGRTAGAAILLAIGAVIFLDIRLFKERWMHPLLLTMPFWLWARIERAGGLQPRQKRLFCYLLLAAIGLVGVIRLARFTIGPPLCSRCRLHAPYQELIDDLKKTDIPLQSILADNEHIAGNLRVWLPQSRILSMHDPWFQPPLTSKEEACLWIWNGLPSLPESLARLRSQTQLTSPIHQVTLPAQSLLGRSSTLFWTWSFTSVSGPCSTAVP